MSKSNSTVISYKPNTFIPFQNKVSKGKKIIFEKAIDECQKLYAKNCVKPNQYVLNQLKKEKLNIYLNYLKGKDLAIIGKILNKFYKTKKFIRERKNSKYIKNINEYISLYESIR